MPVTLQDVNVSPLPDQQVAGSGPLAVLGSNPYQIGQLQYPLEGLGDTDVPHYMTFNINLPKSSKYAADNGVKGSQSSTQTNSKSVPQAAISGPNADQAAAAGLLTTVLGAAQGSGISSFVGSVAAGASVKNLTLTPSTTRLTTAIHLYTPETLLTEYNQGWSSVSLTQALGRFGRNAVTGSKAVMDDIAATGKKLYQIGADLVTQGSVPNASQLQGALQFNSASGRELQGNIAEETGVVGPNFADLVVRSAGRAINPKNEMLFTGTQNRNFQFTWDFQPRSQKEAWQIYQIIRTFKAFAAPEYSNEGTGRYMIPPALFDIGFFFMNAENLALPRISTCALTQIAVDYNHTAPFATFNDGFPVHVNMQLQFTEIDIITRELIVKYGY